MTVQATTKEVICDGCGLGASPEHIARRLRRLELTTRYRPIHIQAVFLGVQSPSDDKDFLYSVEAAHGGEGAALLRAVGIQTDSRDTETVLAEFQKRGFLLTHVLECGEDAGRTSAELTVALRQRLPAVARRLRGSLRPKRVVLISKDLAPVVEELRSAQLGGELVLDGGQPFDFGDSDSVTRLTSRLRSL